MFVEIEWVKHRVVYSVTGWVLFWGVVEPIDARKASVESDTPLKRSPCEERYSTHWSDQMAAADGKMKKYAVEMNRGALLDTSLDKTFRRGL